ncbi:hypothetical protein [Lelliottia amnigena]|uniref:hypothetical protein n=1 Tax=Lelliottia amnigena TaxID=61646 RepID=UPI004056F181
MTFTKEQLQNLIEFNSSDSDGQANAESWEVHKLAEMALAGMEAEPVASPFGYLRVVSGRSFQIMEGSTRPPDRSGDCAGPWFPIWTSAPSPQPLTTSERSELENYRNAQQVVPSDGAIFEAAIDVCRESDSIDEHAWNHGVLAVMSAFSNLRAAMLQAGNHTEQHLDMVDHSGGANGKGNSPVIPESWVMVPEEPTHEMLEAGDEQFGTYEVYRRMLAAAPQQEAE